MAKFVVGQSVVVTVPTMRITPIIEKETGETGPLVQLDFDPAPHKGMLGGLVDFSDRNSDPLVTIDLTGMTEEEARAYVESMLQNIDRLGKEDVRTAIASRGDPAGILPAVAWEVAIAVGTWLSSESGQRTLTAVGKAVQTVGLGIIGSMLASNISDALNKGKPDKGGGDSDSTKENKPPPQDPKERPQVDESPTKLSPAQVVRVKAVLGSLVPPFRDDREENNPKASEPAKPIEKFGPAVDPLADQDERRARLRITTKIVVNNGYTDPVKAWGLPNP